MPTTKIRIEPRRSFVATRTFVAGADCGRGCGGCGEWACGGIAGIMFITIRAGYGPASLRAGGLRIGTYWPTLKTYSKELPSNWLLAASGRSTTIVIRTSFGRLVSLGPQAVRYSGLAFSVAA